MKKLCILLVLVTRTYRR